MFSDKDRAAFIFGQPMEPCPACGGYKMRAFVPLALDIQDEATPHQILGKWARAARSGNAKLQGIAYLGCDGCGHKGPAVDVSGRTSEDCRKDRALYAEMKRLWNAQWRGVPVREVKP